MPAPCVRYQTVSGLLRRFGGISARCDGCKILSEAGADTHTAIIASTRPPSLFYGHPTASAEIPPKQVSPDTV